MKRTEFRSSLDIHSFSLDWSALDPNQKDLFLSVMLRLIDIELEKLHIQLSSKPENQADQDNMSNVYNTDELSQRMYSFLYEWAGLTPGQQFKLLMLLKSMIEVEKMELEEKKHDHSGYVSSQYYRTDYGLAELHG